MISIPVHRLLAVGTAAVLAFAAPAHAATGEVRPAGAGGVLCDGTVSTTYTPGITLAPRAVSFSTTAVFDDCDSSALDGPSGGSFTASGTGTLDCALGQVSGTLLLRWNTGRQSEAQFTSVVDAKPLGETVVEDTGRIISTGDSADQFVGDAFLQTQVVVTPDPVACLTTAGVTSVSGTAVIDIG